MIVPFIEGWIEQWYMYVPGWVKVKEKDAPGESGSEENAAGEPASETMVCVAPSLFTHMTPVPVFTVRVGGSNAKFLRVIEFPSPVEAGGVIVAEGAGEEEQPAAMQANITTAEQTMQNIRREYADILS
jgi:hypothetical protein